MICIVMLNLQAWEVNTHRAIDKTALDGRAQNLSNFINDSEMGCKYLFTEEIKS